MKKEDLIAMGLSEEDAQKIIADAEKEKNTAVTKATKDQLSKEEIEALQTKASAYDKFAEKDLTDAEKLAKQLKEMQEASEKSAKETSELKKFLNAQKVVSSIVAKGIKQEKAEKIALRFASENEAETTEAINDYLDSISDFRESVEAEIRGGELGSGQGGNGGQGDQGGQDKTEQQKIVEQIIGTDTSEDVSDNPYIH